MAPPGGLIHFDRDLCQAFGKVIVSFGARCRVEKVVIPYNQPQWFLAFYLFFQDKRGISAVLLSGQIGVTYKTRWSMLRRIRSTMGQRNTARFSRRSFGGLLTQQSTHAVACSVMA